MRRAQYRLYPSEQYPVKIGELMIDPEGCRVLKGSAPIELTAREFEILCHLAENKGRVINLERLYETIWGEDSLGCDNTMMVHIRHLREMLVKYEFLKIIRKKSTLIIMTASLLLTAFLFGLPIIQYQTYNQDGVIQGAQGIAYGKEQYAISVPLSEEYIAESIGEVQRLFADSQNVGYDGNERFLIGDAYWNHIAPREKMHG